MSKIHNAVSKLLHHDQCTSEKENFRWVLNLYSPGPIRSSPSLKKPCVLDCKCSCHNTFGGP